MKWEEGHQVRGVGAGPNRALDAPRPLRREIGKFRLPTRLMAVFATVLVPIVVVPTSASADGSGTVAATVTPASPCITIDGTTADFGTPVYNTSPSGPD